MPHHLDAPKPVDPRWHDDLTDGGGFFVGRLVRSLDRNLERAVALLLYRIAESRWFMGERFVVTERQFMQVDREHGEIKEQLNRIEAAIGNEPPPPPSGQGRATIVVTGPVDNR